MAMSLRRDTTKTERGGWGSRNPLEQEMCHWEELVALRIDVHTLHRALKNKNASELPKILWGPCVWRALKSRLGWGGSALSVWSS